MARGTRFRPRKKPQQRRSVEMNEILLEASVRVLERDGPEAFTTSRVAEVAGVSVGSLYQYYPNKASLLFCLHEREARQTWSEIEAILDSPRGSPRSRLFRAVHRFFQTEADEAPLRRSLQIAEVLFHESPEFRAIEERGLRRIGDYLREVLPASRDVDFEAELLVSVVTGVAERVTRRPQSDRSVRRWSRACSEMLCHRLGL